MVWLTAWIWFRITEEFVVGKPGAPPRDGDDRLKYVSARYLYLIHASTYISMYTRTAHSAFGVAE